MFVTSENVRDGYLDVSLPKFLSLEFFNKQKSSQLKNGDILINIVGASIGRCCMFNDVRPATVNQAVAIFRVDSNNKRRFVAYCYQEDRIQKVISGTQSESARPNLSFTDLRELQFSLSELPEQQKISTFFESVDDKIALLDRKRALLEDYKKGCMQQLFSQNLRFQDNQGNDFPDWEQKKLYQVADRVKLKNTEGTVTNVLTNSAVQGIISQGDYFDHDVANADNLDRYTIVDTGDLVYNPRISVTASVGPIKRNNLRRGVMSPLYDVFRFRDNKTDFWAQYFAAMTWHRYMKQVANYGARHDRMAISWQDFMDMPLPDEQEKIAEFLSAIDTKISLVLDELTAAQDFKQGLLQQMFV